MKHSFKHWFVHQKGGASYINPPMVKNLQCVNIDGYVTDIITDDAIQYIQDYMKSGNSEPFYLENTMRVSLSRLLDLSMSIIHGCYSSIVAF